MTSASSSLSVDADVIETTLLRGQLRLLQPRVGFHASTDTVLLAAATRVRERQKLLDLGCGVGSAGLCIALKNKNINLIGLDIQEDLIDLACQNAQLNDMADRCRFFAGSLQADKAIPDNAFDSAMTNPPYQAGGKHSPSPRQNKALSHGEDASGVTLKNWIKYLHKKLKQGGYLTMIHRADRLDEVVMALTDRRWFGSLVVLPVHSRSEEPAKRILVQARKERFAPITLRPALVMHEADGRYTTAAADILEGRSVIEL